MFISIFSTFPLYPLYPIREDVLVSRFQYPCSISLTYEFNLLPYVQISFLMIELDLIVDLNIEY